MHPNHYTKIQHLLSEDYAPRLELQEHEENPGFLANVLLTIFAAKGLLIIICRQKKKGKHKRS
jgi:hypothetical protein